MKTLTVKAIVAAAGMLAAASLKELKGAEKFVVIKAGAALREVAERYQAVAKDAQERLRPDDWEELVAQSQKWAELTEAERVAHNERVAAYQAEVEACLADELAKETEVEVGTLDEDALGRLLDSNPEWNVAQAEAVITVIGEV